MDVVLWTIYRLPALAEPLDPMPGSIVDVLRGSTREIREVPVWSHAAGRRSLCPVHMARKALRTRSVT